MVQLTCSSKGEKLFSNSNGGHSFFSVIDELGTLKIDWAVNTIYIYTNEMINQTFRFSLAEVSVVLTETNSFVEYSKLSLESRK